MLSECGRLSFARPTNQPTSKENTMNSFKTWEEATEMKTKVEAEALQHRAGISDYAVAHPVDEILIVAPGYTDEIAGIIRERFDENVRILVLRTDRIEEYQ